MSKAKIQAARDVLIAPGPFNVTDLTDPHNGTPVPRLEPKRAREVVTWYRNVLSDSESLAEPQLFTERLAALDGWLAEPV
jgi:hypothetical protein